MTTPHPNPWPQPSHPTLINVVKPPPSSTTPFSAYSTSLTSLPAGALFTRITNHFFVRNRTYVTVETSGNRYIDLNSDLFFINHSCNPSLEFDMSVMEVRVSRHRDLKRGDVLTFFYPSTETVMAQAFECHCGGEEQGSRRCIGRIQGAVELREEDLEGYWLNEHVVEMLERKKTQKREDGSL